MNSETLANKIKEQLQARDLEVLGVYALSIEPIRKITAIYEQDTDVDIRVCVKNSEVVITIYADHNRNTLELQKRYFPDSENNLATRIVSTVISSAVLVQTL